MADLIAQLAETIAGAVVPTAALAGADGADAIAFGELLGFALPSAPPALHALGEAAAGVADAIGSLDEARLADGDVALAAAGLAASLAAWAGVARGLGGRLAAELPAAFVTESQIDAQFEPRLYAWLVGRIVDERAPLAAAVLALFGAVAGVPRDADPARHQPEFIEPVLRLDRIVQLLRDPAALFRDVYGWGTPVLDSVTLFQRLLALSFRINEGAAFAFPPPALYAACGAPPPPADGPEPMLEFPLLTVPGLARLVLGIFAPPPAAGAAQPLAATLEVQGGAALDLPLGDTARLSIKLGVDIASGLLVLLVPGAGLTLSSDAYGTGARVVADGEIAVELALGTPGTPSELAALDGVGALTAETVFVRAVGRAASGGSPEVELAIGVRGARWTVAHDRSGGFVASVVPSTGLGAGADAAIAWSSRRGVTFDGSGELATRIAVHEALGPFALEAIELGVALAHGVELDVRLTGSARLGPVTATIDGLGAAVGLAFASGDLGPVAPRVALLPPRGIGLAIDAGPVAGGGFLEIQPERHRYFGAVALRGFGLAIGAIGLLDDPPGGPFSLALLVDAVIPPVPLGLGFTLRAVGGFVGVNRGVDLAALRAAVRGPGLSDLLFPSDPVGRAPEIVDTLARFFPPRTGHFVIAPAVRITWGTPILLTADLSLGVELPGSFHPFLAGSLLVTLPHRDLAIVRLQLDVVGDIDFGRSTAALDASLRDSAIAGYPLTGDLAFRTAWAGSPMLLLSAGGFHPRFTPPPTFPVLRRLALQIGDNPRLRLEAYLAVTSNTAQLGAHVDIAFHAAGLEIRGYAGFDALFELSPFGFEAGVQGGASLSWHGHDLAHLALDFLLSGPRPWRARGSATFGVLWWDVSVGFDVTWGDDTPAMLPPPPPIADELAAALAASAAWTAELPPGEAAVTWRRGAAGLDPRGAWTGRQRLVPLGHPITRYAGVALSGSRTFAIRGAAVDGGAAPSAPVSDAFAPAQFGDIDEAQKLVGPSFEQLASGVRIGSGALRTGRGVGASGDVETHIVDPRGPRDPVPPRRGRQDAAVIAATLATGAAARLRRRFGADGAAGPRLRDTRFVIVGRSDLRPSSETAAASAGDTSYAGLRAKLRAAPNPAWCVIPVHEVRDAGDGVVVVRESPPGRNLEFLDLETGRHMTSAEFVAAIRAGSYPRYLVRQIGGIATPVSRGNATTADNLG